MVQVVLPTTMNSLMSIQPRFWLFASPQATVGKRRLGSINRMLVGLHQRPTNKFDGLQKRYGGLPEITLAERRRLTRSVTPAVPPSSCDELMTIALALRERVELGPQQLFRLVGVGLSNFQLDVESSLFENGVAASSAELLI